MGAHPIRKSLRRAAALTLALPLFTRAASTTLTWDAAPATPGVQGGAGAWADAGVANWFNGATDRAWANANGDSALFNAPPAGVINLSGTVAAHIVTFDTPGYTLTGGTLRIGYEVVGGIITNADATVASTVVAPNGFDTWYKDGPATLTLTGNNSASFIPFTIKAGTVAFSGNASLPPNTHVTNGSRVLYTGTGDDLSVNLTVGGSDTAILDIPDANAYVNLTGLLMGSGTLIKQGAGTFSPRSTNTNFFGDLRIEAGTLQVDDPNVLHGRPISLRGAALLLRADTPTNFPSTLTTTPATTNTLHLDRLTAAGATSGAHLLPNFQNLGQTTLSSNANLGLTVKTFANGGTLNLGNLPFTVTGPLSTTLGIPLGAIRFGHNDTAVPVGRRGFWVANAVTTNTFAANFEGQTDDADLLLGVNGNGAPVTNLTLSGKWRGGGAAATSTFAFSNTAQLTLGASLHVNTLTTDRTASRPLYLVGSGSMFAVSNLILDPAFVADHSNSGATDDAFAQIQLTDATLVSQNSASLPAATMLASPAGPAYHTGAILFDKPGGTGLSGGTWIVRAADQTYDGAVRFNMSGQIKLEKNLTLTGGAVRYADNQFQIASGRNLTLTGPGTLTLAGDLGFASGSSIFGNDATVVFNTDPGAGWYAGHFTRNPDGTVNTPPAPVNNLILYAGNNATGGAIFNAPLTRLSELHISGTAVASASLDPTTPKILHISRSFTVFHSASGSHSLDLTNNAMITFGVATTYASLRDMIRNHDLRSSLADANHALGYASAFEVATHPGGSSAYTWLGQTVNESDLLVRYTLAGDANLDGSVDFNDLVKLAQNYNTSQPSSDPAWWLHGDFNLDGVVDFSDLVKLAQNYNTALTPAAVPGAPVAFESDLARAFASVPEPSGALLVFAACGFALRRRRRGTPTLARS